MLAGNLRDKIDIYIEVVNTEESYNEPQESYQYSFSDRAETSFASAGESMIGQMEVTGKTMKFKVRFKLGRYSEQMIIKWRNDYYNIRGIDPDRRRAYMILTGDRKPEGTLTIIP